MTPFLLCLIMACGSIETGAGLPAPVPAPTTFRLSVDMVPLTVTVTTGDRAYVGHLTVDDFQVFDNGQPQPITVFGGADVPIDVALLLDVSSSVFDRFDLVQAAAKGFLATLRPGDRGAVIGFNERLRVLTSWTNDRAELDRGVDEVFPGGNTALYTALYIALRGLNPQGPADVTSRRRVIVVLSDGDDTGSLMPYEGVLDACQRTHVTIYTIRVKARAQALWPRWLSGRREARSGDYVMTTFARATGGRAFAVGHEGHLPAVYDDIAADLANQYLLGYVPTAATTADGFHSIAVLVPHHRGAVARTRIGYIRDDGARPVPVTP